jgi:glutathionylspermidine synthase
MMTDSVPTDVCRPWTCGQPLAPECYARVVRRAIFDCCKWHTQADDRPVLCPFPLVLDEDTWERLARLAEALAREALAAEQELLLRPDLHRRLGLPRALGRCLRRGAGLPPTAGGARVMRFDFHWTSDGWRISEANTDVAGGFIEAAGVTRLVAVCYPDCRPVGDPAGALADAIRDRVGAGARVGLMHLTVYTEDRQIMLYLARRLEERGLATCLFSPVQLRWNKGRAGVAADWYAGPVDLLLRFFPADWLPRLPALTGWQALVTGGQTPVCNPASAVLTQSKRFPLTWDCLATPLPTWRALLPETRSPRDVPGREDADWVLKPALGHEGLNVGIKGVTEPADWRGIGRAAYWFPGAWAAQRRFDVLALPTPDGPLYPCLGVYVIDGRAAGAYGRVGLRPLIDDRSREIAVLVRSGTVPGEGPTHAAGRGL